MDSSRFLALPALFVLALTALAQAPAVTQPAVKDVTGLLKPIREKHDLPGMVAAIVKGEDVVALGADGVRKRGGSEAISVTDRMHLGSCTKSMTATLCAMLVEEGKLSWDTKVGDVFGDLSSKMHPDWKDVRLEELLTNHAGAPANLDAGGLWGKLWTHTGTPREQRAALAEGVLTRAPEAKPGSKFIYSNAGFSIAGAMAERVMNTPYEELMKKRLFVPLHMDSAGFGAPGTAGRIDEPRGHKDNGKPVEVGPGSDNPAAIAPAGRVHCSIGDWAKYVALHLRGEKDADDGKKHLLSGASFKKLHTPFGHDEANYAMGWGVTQRAWGGKVLTHNGSNTMWFCVVWIAPEKDFAVLVATNQGGDEASKACDEAASALIQDHLGLPPPIEGKKDEPKRDDPKKDKEQKGG